MGEEIPFDPFPFLDTPHKQTILGSLFSFILEPVSVQKLVVLPDGDRISLEVTTPRDWKPTDLTVLMVHGLCGSHKSPYLIRITKRLEDLGIRAVRFNMRGCGSGKGLSKNIYHCGRSEDIFYAIQALKKEHPDSPIVLIGFSMGGNMVLKLAGELGSAAEPYLVGVIGVSPPVELYSSVQMIGQPENSFYEKYFYRLLRSDVHYRHKTFKDLPSVRLPRDLKLYEFDQMYTAPMCGFKNAMDYYDKCSSVHMISDIELPTKILLAEDDPIISPRSLDPYILPANVSVFRTKKGGHMGYLGNPKSEKGFYWLDSVVIDWILDF